MAKHRFSRRGFTRRNQLIGLTAALAAAAGTVGVSAAASGSPAAPNTSTGLSPAQADALIAARVDRRDLGSRDASRIDVSLDDAQKAAAATAARQRAEKLAANATLTQRRALALAATKAAAAKKAADSAKALAAAKAEAAAKAAAIAKQAAIAKAAAAPKIVLPTTGYHLTARFNQAGGRWAHNHTGLDFAAPMGTPVLSVMAGEVIQADWEGAYGRQVKVRHADGTVTSYSHMSEFDVSVGDTVQAGTMVGRIGMTGNTTGPHVHFEVLPGGGAPIDPEPWLREHGLNP
ncbi:murein DD-endopeptidase MepM/ murein hydrolase activator NlpD [Kribbella jejuensis]|uniref:Murein DD-endopeptidase MepM/ murein hydrolase activator NlpD n=1 Tax=Kribbella jejuensis TaxID=236068 RepID=A0A542ESD2_9ACTN|nr:murein DD-endopeptidase MepM/ murein hydrolase activator NlpD [Kribbella jejuensis]